MVCKSDRKSWNAVLGGFLSSKFKRALTELRLAGETGRHRRPWKENDGLRVESSINHRTHTYGGRLQPEHTALVQLHNGDIGFLLWEKSCYLPLASSLDKGKVMADRMRFGVVFRECS